MILTHIILHSRKYIHSLNFITFCRTVSSSITRNNTSKANAYIYLCSKNDEGGMVGYAWKGGTCDDSLNGYYKSAIIEYFYNDFASAVVCFGFNLFISVYNYHWNAGIFQNKHFLH